MTQDIQNIKSNLSKYQFIKCYLEYVITQRLQIKCYEYGMLTAHLLDPSEFTKSDLDRLENVLKLGKEQCMNFQSIFRERVLTKDPKTVDGEIINLLAEVKTFEFLHEHGFKEITKINRKKGAKTVDFTAKRNNFCYAIEVTRLGLASSDKKKPQFDKLSKQPVLTVIDSKEPQNVNRIAEDIYSEIVDKYPQIKSFCESQKDDCKGILTISNGRDYFVAGKYENKLYELQPHTVCKMLRQSWASVKGQESFRYLNHIVITMGKDIQKAIIYPELETNYASSSQLAK